MLDIRPAESNDLPAILQVLRASLGDPHGRRNEDHWNWKHQHSPFGRSLVFLAFENQKLAGVRAMMPWEFRFGSTIIHAWRAVDTATAPEFQGKKVFSTLTQEMVQHLSTLGPSLIFNTPNPISAAGYFKMGWTSAGKSAALIKPIMVNMLSNRLFKNAGHKFSNDFSSPSDESLHQYFQNFNSQLITNWTQDRLNWRYGQVPDLKYNVIHSENGTIMYRLMNRKSLLELRLVELFPINPLLSKDIQSVIDDIRPDVVTCLSDGQGLVKKYLPGLFLSAKSNAPVLVCRHVQDEQFSKLFRNEESRYFSAGTLELF